MCCHALFFVLQALGEQQDWQLKLMQLKTAAQLAVIQALDYNQPDEVNLACQIMGTHMPLAGDLQQAFFGGICQSADVALALEKLQLYSQQAEQQEHFYSILLQRLASVPGVPRHEQQHIQISDLASR